MEEEITRLTELALAGLFPDDVSRVVTAKDYIYRSVDDENARHKEFCARMLAKRPFATRKDRTRRAKIFLNYYAKSQSDLPVIKACTWLGGERLWKDKWLGITWVALRGTDSLCVVARRNDLQQLEQKLLLFGDRNETTESFLRSCWTAIVNEVEDIEDSMFGGRCKRPFSVVTVISSTSDHEASRAESCATKTIKFLQEEMKNGATFTYDKTIQTAISALQHLFCREFKANEIQAFAWKDCNLFGAEVRLRRQDPDLEELLASINEPNDGIDIV